MVLCALHQCVVRSLVFIFLPAALFSFAEGRVALCITGGARTFGFPAVHKAIFRNLLTADTDIFAFLFASTPAFKDDNDVYCQDKSKRLELLFAPHNHAVAHLSVYDEGTCDRFSRHGSYCNECGGGTMFMQLGWIDNCFRHAVAYASKRNFSYTHFIRARPDFYVGSRFPSDAFTQTDRIFTARKNDYPGSDMLMLISEPMMQSWWRPMVAEILQPPACNALRSHCCMESHLFEGTHKPQTTQLRELNGMLVRRWNRVECWDPYPSCGNDTEKNLLLAELAAQHDVVECATTREDAISAHEEG